MSIRRRLAVLLVGLSGTEAPENGEAASLAAPVPAAAPGPASALSPADEKRDAAIRHLVEACAHAFVSGDRHVRGNIMTFTPDRQRRTVNRATAFNMDGDPDATLEIGAHAGASGKAALLRRAAVADLTLLQITAVPAWGLSAVEQSRVRTYLRSILSVPIFNPEDANGPLLGTLQVDSDLTVEEAGFNRPEAAELMQQFADVLSLMMIGLSVRLGDVDVPSVSSLSRSRVHNATQVEAGIYVANASTSIFTISNAHAPLSPFER